MIRRSSTPACSIASLVCAIALVLLVSWQAVQAATWTVNTSNDSHDVTPGDGICGDPSNPDSTCSFRAAIEESNSNAGKDNIYISASLSPIRLRLGELLISDEETVIRGIGGSCVIDGAFQPYRSNILRIAANSVRISGLTFRRAHANAIVVNSSGNLIGGVNSSDANIIVGAGIDGSDSYGILIEGPSASQNEIAGNMIGMLPTGGVVIANANGIGLSESTHDNLIGGESVGARNIISGNTGNGISLTKGANGNRMVGNFVGPDVSGISGPGNGQHGIFIGAGCEQNMIGGPSLQERNFICANHGDGIRMSGAGVERNQIIGNSIGLDVTGYVALGNWKNGISLENGAARNTIGSSDSGTVNIISGNLGHGISITGTGSDENQIVGNYVGFDSSGYGPIGNGDYFSAGIYLGESVSGTQIGGSGPFERNHFAYNIMGGIYLDGADHNRIQGNYIGVSVNSVSAGYNGTGVVLRNGGSDNLIGGDSTGEGNTISGNLMDEFPFGAGILMADPGTDRNLVMGNMIGTDASGSRQIPNASAGVVICDGASYNRIGGANPGEGNIISGNGYSTNLVSLGRGVHLYGEGTSHNTISGNLIGLGADSLSPVRNLGNGVGIFLGAHDNVVGGVSEEAGNLISGNRCHGVLVQSADSRRNLIKYNRIFDNDSLGIGIRQSAQESIQSPILVSYITGVVFGSAAPGDIIDIYLADEDLSGAGEGTLWLAGGIADEFGEFAVAVPSQPEGAKITAVATDSLGNSSQFAANLPLDQTTDVDDSPGRRPVSFALEQNYPNPFNPSTRISYSLPFPSRVSLTVFNLLGERVTVLVEDLLPAGRHQSIWDGTDEGGNSVASGVYIYRLEAGSQTVSRKMLLIK